VPSHRGNGNDNDNGFDPFEEYIFVGVGKFDTKNNLRLKAPIALGKNDSGHRPQG